MDWPLLIVLLLTFGLTLLLLEIFVVPGFGPVGVGAIIFLATGTYLSWIKLSLAWGISVTLGSVISVILSIILLKKMGIANKLVLNRNIGNKSQSGIQPQRTGELINSPEIFEGETGLTQSDLRPSGIAEFQNRRLNVIADGIYIKRNTKVRIVRIEGNKIFVEEE